MNTITHKIEVDLIGSRTNLVRSQVNNMIKDLPIGVSLTLDLSTLHSVDSLGVNLIQEWLSQNPILVVEGLNSHISEMFSNMNLSLQNHTR